MVGFWRADHGGRFIGVWEVDLTRWLKPFLDRLGQCECAYGFHFFVTLKQSGLRRLIFLSGTYHSRQDFLDDVGGRLTPEWRSRRFDGPSIAFFDTRVFWTRVLPKT